MNTIPYIGRIYDYGLGFSEEEKKDLIPIGTKVIMNYLKNAEGKIRLIFGKDQFYVQPVENILAIIWEIVIAAEFAFSCILFKAFRLDSLLIVLMQGLAILLMLLYSRKIDYSVNKKHNQKSQKNGDVTLHNTSVLKGRELSKSILYVFTCLCVFILELTVLTIPKLPPKIDDIFSDTRVLEYEYYKNV
jgi:hypothetical protein